MTLHIPFDNSYAALPGPLFTRLGPTPVAAPSLIAFNDDLACLMGITRGTADDAALAQVFSGNAEPAGAAPLAQVYAGHQFGAWNPQLGDGRAILLGETLGTDGMRRDIQLKGSGPTPYSRMGDGRAWLGPVLREYVVSEAMHALGIPTTRALAAVQTGEPVYREAGALPGAVLTRVAASHLRVGTFQFFAARGDTTSLQTLTDHAIARHYPKAQTPLDLLNAVIARQAELIAKWMGAGFIHGVMNTDNTAISGETIDYGPCAFIDDFHPATVFSSIDRQGRYAYDNQPDIIVWNMAQLATALLPLEQNHDAAIAAYTAAVHAMPALIRTAWLRTFAAKIGITAPQETDAALITDLLTLMANQSADFTNTFRALATGTARDQFVDPAPFDDWASSWQTRLRSEPDPEAMITAVNPAIIPRNHRIEQMIEAAVVGDLGPFRRLVQALSAPYTDQPENAELTAPPTKEETVTATFCGT